MKSIEKKILEGNTPKYLAMGGHWAMGSWVSFIFLFLLICIFYTFYSGHSILNFKRTKFIYGILATNLTLCPRGGSEDQTGDSKETGPRRRLWFHCPLPWVSIDHSLLSSHFHLFVSLSWSWLCTALACVIYIPISPFDLWGHWWGPPCLAFITWSACPRIAP